jgi:hypothetical protein
MWNANGKTTTLQLFLDSLSPKTEKLSLEGTMDLFRDRLILEDAMPRQSGGSSTFRFMVNAAITPNLFHPAVRISDYGVEW